MRTAAMGFAFVLLLGAILFYERHVSVLQTALNQEVAEERATEESCLDVPRVELTEIEQFFDPAVSNQTPDQKVKALVAAVRRYDRDCLRRAREERRQKLEKAKLITE